jgi:hypothetical protein
LLVFRKKRCGEIPGKGEGQADHKGHEKEKAKKGCGRQNPEIRIP